MKNEIILDSLAAEIRTEHDAVRVAAETAAQHAIRCGHLLAQAKDGLAHGQWLPWLQDHCALSERTAQAYMRIARKHGELDSENAQRVADLPVREAMKAIADERATPPESDPWAWAERQITEPLNAFDLSSGFGSYKCRRNKMYQQLGCSTAVAMFSAMHTRKNPMLRLAPTDEIVEALRLLAPIAKGDTGSLDIDPSGVSAINLWIVLMMTAQREFVFLWDEIEHRQSAYVITEERPAAAVDDQYRRDCEKISDAFLASADERREAMLAEAGAP